MPAGKSDGAAIGRGSDRVGGRGVGGGGGGGGSWHEEVAAGAVTSLMELPSTVVLTVVSTLHSKTQYCIVALYDTVTVTSLMELPSTVVLTVV